jgi:hypothetical protein
MKNILIVTIVTCFFFQGLTAQKSKLDTLLYDLPNVIFTQIETAKNFEATYELRIKQPIDHSDTSKGYFYQRVFLSHKGFDEPTVMMTEGYDRSQNRISELTELINGNQLLIEHRYFGVSVPDSLDYKYLTLKQATADLHHINTIFKNIYKKKWLSTGISKGGATTLFYRYFYPDDVDVSVNYVGPINNAFEDKRIYKFLDTVGTKACRDKINSFQRHLLKNKKEILPLIEAYSLGANLKFTYLNLEKAFEFAVLEYPFSFWQYGYSCENIPEETISNIDALKYFTSVSDISFFSDKDVIGYGSHYYQSATEFGYYGYETSEFKGLLNELSSDQNPHATFMPNKMKVPFNPKLLNEINLWLPKYGNKIIHIYGTLDTWSATAVLPSKEVDALWFFLNGKHHGNARIKSMNPKEKEKFIATLERWLSIKIDDH